LSTTGIDPGHARSSPPFHRGRCDSRPSTVIQVHGVKEAVIGARTGHTSKHHQTGFIGGHGHTSESMRGQSVIRTKRKGGFGRVELSCQNVYIPSGRSLTGKTKTSLVIWKFVVETCPPTTYMAACEGTYTAWCPHRPAGFNPSATGTKVNVDKTIGFIVQRCINLAEREEESVILVERWSCSLKM
jgi:hypothetical protein